MDEIILSGQSGIKYRYWAFRFGYVLSPNPGNYIFAMETSSHRFEFIEIGQTVDLSKYLGIYDGLPDHIKIKVTQYTCSF